MDTILGMIGILFGIFASIWFMGVAYKVAGTLIDDIKSRFRGRSITAALFFYTSAAMVACMPVLGWYLMFVDN